MTINVEVTPMEREEVEQQSLAIPTRAEALVVDSAAAYEVAAGFLRDLKTVRKRVDETFDPSIRKAHEAHKAAVALKKQFTDPLDAGERIIKGKITGYLSAEERRRREEELKLQAEAQQRAEEARIAEAVALEQAGYQGAAEQAIATPVKAAPVLLPPAAPKVAGLSKRENWTFRVVDPALIPREYLMIDETKVRGVVRAMKGETRIPGIEVYDAGTIAATARR